MRTAARREEKKNGGAAVVRLCICIRIWRCAYAESGSSDEMEYALRPAKPLPGMAKSQSYSQVLFTLSGESAAALDAEDCTMVTDELPN